jgi:hypothetical protein
MDQLGQDHSPQLADRIVFRRHGLFHACQDPFLLPADGGMEDILFPAREVMVQGRFCYPQGLGDISQGGLAEAVPGKGSPGGVENAVSVQGQGQAPP